MPPSSSRVTVVPRRRASMTCSRTALLSSLRPRISSRIAPSRCRHSARCAADRSPWVCWIVRSIGSAMTLVCPSRNCRSLRCASCAACQSVASRSASANRAGVAHRLRQRVGDDVRDADPGGAADDADLAEGARPAPEDGLQHQEDDARPGEPGPPAGRRDRQQGADRRDVPGGVAEAALLVRVELRRDEQRQRHRDGERERGQPDRHPAPAQQQAAAVAIAYRTIAAMIGPVVLA